jgi:hypothetical protein
LEPYLQDYKCFNEILQIKFLQYIVFFLSRDVLNQFQLRTCNVYPPPKFLYGFSLFERMVFVAIGGGGAVAPPLATPPWLRHWFPVGVIYLKLLSGTICCHLDKVDNGNRSTCHKLFQQDQYRLFATSCYELVNVFNLM